MNLNANAQARRRGTYLSLGVALAVLTLKLGAFWLTGSVALLSDAAESIVNVAAGLSVLVAVRLALSPPDYEHPYGHQKAEYLSSAFEGSLILLAAGMILVTAVQRLFDPAPVTRVGEGVSVTLVATLFNGGAALYLRRLAERTASAALAANARHLMTDVWSSVGVIGAVLLVSASGWVILDPLIATFVALNIVREGWQVLSSSFSNLLDARLPDVEESVILEILDAHPQILGYHRLRSRRSGEGRFAEVDVFVSPELTVYKAHDLVTELEDEIHRQLPNLVTTVHVEPFVAGMREGSRSPREEFESQ